MRSRSHPNVCNIRVRRKLAAEEGNVVVSPVSIAVALAMAAAGERIFLRQHSCLQSMHWSVRLTPSSLTTTPGIGALLPPLGAPLNQLKVNFGAAREHGEQLICVRDRFYCRQQNPLPNALCT